VVFTSVAECWKISFDCLKKSDYAGTFSAPKPAGPLPSSGYFIDCFDKREIGMRE
jgi:hypothetical protein